MFLESAQMHGMFLCVMLVVLKPEHQVHRFCKPNLKNVIKSNQIHMTQNNN